MTSFEDLVETCNLEARLVECNTQKCGNEQYNVQRFLLQHGMERRDLLLYIYNRDKVLNKKLDGKASLVRFQWDLCMN